MKTTKCTEKHRLCVKTRDYLADWCCAKYPKTNSHYVCSREPGHSGDHVACSPSSESHNLARWPQKVKAEAAESPAGTKLTNPKDFVGSDKLPLHLWPATASALGCLALLDGMLKYGRTNWRVAGVRASIYIDACLRHLTKWFEGQEIDPDSGVHHFGHALACLAILVDAQAAGKLNDDRLVKGGYIAMVDELTPHVAKLKALHKDKKPKHYTIEDNKEIR
jgi:hypothetical protein